MSNRGTIAEFMPEAHPILQMHRIRCLSASHRQATASERQRVALTPAEQEAFFARLTAARDHIEDDAHRQAEEILLLSTCNRTEIYLVGVGDRTPFGDGADRLAQVALAVLGEIKNLHAEELGIFETLHGSEAVRHLFDVATGLDSVVLGDTQILSQLKDAFGRSHTHRCVGPVLNTVLHAAFKAGRRARSETRISDGKVSVASAGVDLATQRLGGNLFGRTALLIGAGKIGRLTVRQLVSNGVEGLVIANRTAANAETLCAEAALHGIEAIVCGLADIDAHLATADMVICAIGGDGLTDEPVITTRRWAAAMETREAMREAAQAAASPVVILDLGMPANVAPGVADFAGVDVIGVDDLDSAANRSRVLREAEIPLVRQIIEDEWAALDDRDSAIRRGVLDALYRRFTDISQREAATQNKKHGAPQSEAELVEYSLRLVRKLLAPVSQRFAGERVGVGSAELDALKSLVDLFGLHPDLPAPTNPPPPPAPPGE